MSARGTIRTGAVVVAIEGGEGIFTEVLGFATGVELLIDGHESVFGEFAVGARRARMSDELAGSLRTLTSHGGNRRAIRGSALR